MWSRLFICLALLTPGMPASSQCECLWQGSFVDVQHTADLVIAGEVITGKGNSIDLHVVRHLRGSSAGEILRIWLKTGDYCRPQAALFPPGSAWVMALHQIDEDVPGGFDPGTPNISYGRIGDYQLSSCGGYWLSLGEGYVSGALVQSPRWVHEPKMTPVLLDLVAAFIEGKADANALLEASREDPALRELMLDTRAFLRGGDQ
ncbi:delta-aminolevulinic acid dehydratase [Pseudohalioglobus lutimaris]|uniref:Delta-aminolevulinic acid dehydratase n=1 Tax=Pseudohalioglobus lutimaris TaxID=1737061 RepID=A0A2N5X1B8_9GAMM|nr:delta-aminolevulinic acid dehydratase [Pseudohalioglobus lutimaris]PLW68240.1 delta-aminolevulinic acid dehydratase [Pseudohalioglobus lutimaris]